MRFILILQHYVSPSATGDLCLTYLHPQLPCCLSVLQIPLAACLPSPHTITRQLSLSVTAAPSLSLYYPPGPDWYLNKVKLKITDVDDNIPEWNMKPYPYLAVVSPEAAAGTFVYQLQAHDGDEGKSGEVEYFLSDGKLCADHIRTHTEIYLGGTWC